MKSTFEQVYLQAKVLPPTDRAALASRLLMELEGPPDADVENAWLDEIERRLAAYDRGEVQGIPAADVLERIRTRRRQ